MKKALLYGFAAAILPLACACSENYLDLKPQSSVVPETLFTSPSDAQYAVNGIGKLMCSQFMSAQGRNGEGTMLTYFGDYPGFACQKADFTGWANTINGKYHENDNNGNMYFSWQYPYQIIVNANTIINNVPSDVAGETGKEWDFVKGEALVYRAHAYLRLVQNYCRRWSDSNGASRGVIIRLDDTTDPMPAASLKEVYALIYADLDEAIALFQKSGKSRDEVWMPNEDVAHALYSRAALTREDWSKAASESRLAQKNFKIMGIDNYCKGFNEPNQEWIWCAYNSETQDIYYYSFFAYIASNSKSSTCRTNPYVISRQVVEAIPANDSRLKLYAIPTEEEMPKNPKLVSGTGKVVFTSDAALAKLSGANLVNAQQQNAFYNRIKGSGSFIKNRLYSTTTLYYYHNTKFQAQNDLGVGQVPIARMAEMLYNEAEAEYQLGNASAAQAALTKAVAPYVEGYVCDKTGNDLFEEICKFREFDLNGEGFSWFDAKRRGSTMVRKSWTQGGNWNTSFAQTVTPEMYNHWTFVYPKIETQYNDLVTTFEN